MTHALTRLLGRTRRKRSPEYLPPYFWHRATVWFTIYLVLARLFSGLLELMWPEHGFWWGTLLSFTLWVLCLTLMERIRRRWSTRTMATLLDRLQSWAAEGADDYAFDEALTKLELLGHELRRYYNYTAFDSLSIRLTEWQGPGTKFTFYERRKPKREIVFYHD